VGVEVREDGVGAAGQAHGPRVVAGRHAGSWLGRPRRA
jgi:hypothetical protein